MEENDIIKTALAYKHSLGFNVLPIVATWNENKGKYDKKPLVSWVDLQKRVSTDEEIKKWWSENPRAGIGAVVGSISGGIIAIDCDSQSAVNEIENSLSDSVNVPCSKSISGARHYFFQSDKVFNKKVKFYSDFDMQAENSLITLPPTSGRNGDCYEWINEPKNKSDFPPVTSALQSALNNNKESTLYREVMKLCKEGCKEDILHTNTELTKPYIGNIWENGKRDDNLYHVAHDLRQCRNEEDYIRQVLRAIISSWGEVNEKWINEKIDSVLKKEKTRKESLIQEIRNYILIQKSLQEPNILLTDAFHTLQILTKEDKNNAYVAVNRICTDGNLIKKQEDKRGVYRILYNEKDNAKMDLITESELQEVKVTLPIDLTRMCVISPGNIIVVAGSKSSGKTAFLLNVAHFNQKNFDVVYLNSEMHETEFKKRLKRFAPLRDWNITGYKCHNNFDDYIVSDPKKIYIIDYLEIHKDFYDIATPIRKIHEKLGDSICFIGIQMKAGAELGRGGDFSAEKARLYLTMDYVDSEKKTKVTIYDAKEPRPPFDSIRGQWRFVKIKNGSDLIINPQDNWKW